MGAERQKFPWSILVLSLIEKLLRTYSVDIACCILVIDGFKKDKVSIWNVQL